MVGQVLMAGVPVSVLNMELACAEIDRRIRAKAGGYFIFRDVNGVVQANDDPVLLEAHLNAACVAPDGMPLVWLLKLKGFKEAERVCGPDTLPEFCRRYQHAGFRHYFFGSTPEVTERLVQQLKAQFPGLQVCGWHCPPFRPIGAPLDAHDLERIREATPDIVWIGLGTPKQELWMNEGAAQLPGCVLMGVGAAFDFHAGSRRRAPAWMQRYGLEWCHRLFFEPQRLGKRYMIGIPRFVALLVTRGRSKAASITQPKPRNAQVINP